MRPLLLAVLVALAPPTAWAKEPVSATVCGASGCVTIDDPPRALAGWGPNVLEAPPSPGPFYRVELRMSQRGDAWRVWYVPGSERSVATAGGGGRMSFARLDGPARAAFARVTRGVEPFRAPVVVQALVDGRPASGPGSYLTLAGRPDELDQPPLAADWITIELRADVESPWTGGVALLLSPSRGILQDGFAFSRVDPETVERILARHSLASTTPQAPGGASVPVLAGALAAALALVGGVVVAGRRLRPSPVP
jgi:hypothetical protein